MQLKEFLPNPVGSDKEGEYIKLFNDGSAGVLLDGWKLKDASGKIFNLNGNLATGSELTLSYSQTKISLNNNSEQIFLYDDTGKLIDELSYSGQASEGQIINREKRQVASENNFGSEVPSSGTFNDNNNLIHDSLFASQVIFINFLTAAILAGLGLYIILQLEKKLEIKLW